MSNSMSIKDITPKVEKTLQITLSDEDFRIILASCRLRSSQATTSKQRGESSDVSHKLSQLLKQVA